MKPQEFIKQYGWKKVRDGIRNSKPHEAYLMGIYNSEPKEIDNVIHIDRTPCRANIDDLKQLVDAWELVELKGGLYQAKKHYLDMREAINQVHYSHSCEFESQELKKAIELVESVNE